MLFDREKVWWIVPAGQQVRHAITEHPGSRPAGDIVNALCTAQVKLPYDTWPMSKEPASRGITHHCSGCEAEVTERQQRIVDLKVVTWDS